MDAQPEPSGASSRPFHEGLKLCRIAFERRHPDAAERLHRLRRQALDQADVAVKRATILTAVAAAGIDFQWDAHDRLFYPLDEAERLLGFARETYESTAGLVSAIDEMLAAIARRRGLLAGSSDLGPTPETVTKAAHGRHIDPVMRLWALEHLDDAEVRNCYEIARIVRHITVGVVVKPGPLARLVASGTEEEPETVVRWSPQDAAADLALLHEHVYRPWATRNRRAMPMVIALVFDGEALSTIAQRRRQRKQRCLDAIKRALADYAAVRARYRRRARAEADLRHDGPLTLAPRVHARGTSQGILEG